MAYARDEAAMTDGPLRAIRAEAKQAERIRLHDEVAKLWDSTPSRGGNARAALMKVRQLFALPPDGSWDEQVGSITSEIDSVDVGVQEGDVWPVRVQTYDGADDVTAMAYLTTEQARDLAATLIFAADRCDAAPQPEPEGDE